MVEIRTDRLLLRPINAGDLAAFRAILADPQVMAYWSSPPHRGLAETEEWLVSEMSIPEGEGEDFAVELGGRLIGKVGLYRFPEVGFIFHRDVWGQGYAREALMPVLDRAFTCHALPAIEADVDPRNQASLRLLGRLGFQELGRASRTWHIAGQWCDSVYLRLTAPTAGRTDSQPEGMGLHIHEDDLSGEPTRALLALHLAAMHANSPAGHVFALDRSGLQVPGVTVWSAWIEGSIAGVGALKEVDPHRAEVKSMRTHPNHLRKGVAAVLLEHIIEVARGRGYCWLSLETGSGPAFDAALALYRRRGFVDGTPFGDYVCSTFNQFLHLKLTA